MNVKNPAERLREAAETYEQKSKEYGNNYKQIGHVMAAMFPAGLTITTPGEWNKLHLFLLGMVKKTRFAVNFDGGHDDSLLDDMVYDAMLLETVGEEGQRREQALGLGSASDEEGRATGKVFPKSWAEDLPYEAPSE